VLLPAAADLNLNAWMTERVTQREQSTQLETNGRLAVSISTPGAPTSDTYKYTATPLPGDAEEARLEQCCISSAVQLQHAGERE